MKELCKATAVSLLCAGILIGCGDKEDTKVERKIPVVLVAQVVEYKLLNTIRDSFKAEMEALSYKDGEDAKLDFKDAGGQQSMLSSIMSTLVGDRSDVIVVVAVPAAIVATKYSRDIPVVFSAVSDPVGAGLMDDLKKSNNNITGISGEIQIGQILDLALKVDPNPKMLGFTYSSPEVNSVSNLTKAKESCKKHDIKLVGGGDANITEVQSAAGVLADKYDAIFAPNDNTVASSMSALVETASKKKVPVYIGADSMVSGGGFMTVGIGCTELGKETARMTDKILKDEDVENLPVKVFKDNLNIYINEKMMETLGIQLPKDVGNSKDLVMA